MRRCMIVKSVYKADEKEDNIHYQKAIEVIKKLSYDVAEPQIQGCLQVPNPEIWKLADVMKCLASCEAVYFCSDWQMSKHGKIVHAVAEDFGLKCFYEGVNI